VEALSEDLGEFRPLHAVRAELLERVGKPDAAAEAFRRAAALPGNEAETTVLQRRASALSVRGG
jgi:predicted RNA polymerase sigma factor